MTTPEVTLLAPEISSRRSVSWGAIFAGLAAAIALQILFWMLGAGLGFAAYDPITSDEPLAALGKGALLIQGLSAVVSLWFGGWIAGRFTPSHARATGCHHGFLVWCASTLAGVLVVALGAGWAASSVTKLAGAGASAIGKPVAEGIAEMGKEATERSADALESYVDEALGGSEVDSTAATVRAERQISFALSKMFRAGRDETTNVRAEVVRALEENTGRSQAEANRLVDEWTADYRALQEQLTELKNEAETKARAAAEKSADALAAFGLVGFFAFVIGAASAAWGGKHGAACASRHEAKAVVIT